MCRYCAIHDYLIVNCVQWSTTLSSTSGKNIIILSYLIRSLMSFDKTLAHRYDFKKVNDKVYDFMLELVEE